MNFKQMIKETLENGDYAERRVALANKNLHPDQILKAMDDPSWIVRKAAVQHPNADRRTKSKGLKDDHVMVRLAAKDG